MSYTLPPPPAFVLYSPSYLFPPPFPVIIIMLCTSHCPISVGTASSGCFFYVIYLICFMSLNFLYVTTDCKRPLYFPLRMMKTYDDDDDDGNDMLVCRNLVKSYLIQITKNKMVHFKWMSRFQLIV